LLHHDNRVESAVGVRLDSDVEGIPLPPPIDDVTIPVPSRRQCDDLLPVPSTGSMSLPSRFQSLKSPMTWTCAAWGASMANTTSLDVAAGAKGPGQSTAALTRIASPSTDTLPFSARAASCSRTSVASAW